MLPKLAAPKPPENLSYPAIPYENEVYNVFSVVWEGFQILGPVTEKDLFKFFEEQLPENVNYSVEFWNGKNGWVKII